MLVAANLLATAVRFVLYRWWVFRQAPPASSSAALAHPGPRRQPPTTHKRLTNLK